MLYIGGKNNKIKNRICLLVFRHKDVHSLLLKPVVQCKYLTLQLLALHSASEQAARQCVILCGVIYDLMERAAMKVEIKLNRLKSLQVYSWQEGSL